MNTSFRLIGAAIGAFAGAFTGNTNYIIWGALIGYLAITIWEGAGKK